ncbi:hypothetical protein THRCLA_01040 [Thraustotheca clavata]|uniref:Centromere protein L n=1 Tax=Thraustotheca clavata TaxID=74557 RepID=A0A1W0A9G7_9STRA|nr:hypothetical protein THRCLA_01040 [Thraustotheca clavata]
MTSIDQLIVEGAWNVYSVSPLYKFVHDKDVLATDAMALVAYLRTSNGELHSNQSISVSVRSKKDLALFSIHEQLVGGPRRLGGFMYYTPNADTSTMKTRTDVLLLQGNEQLVGQVCAWMQYQYQCVVALHAVNVNSISMELFAYNLYQNMLAASDSLDHAPLKLTLHSENSGKPVQSVTISIPWKDILASQQSLAAAANEGTRRSTLTAPESERLIRGFITKYFVNLPVEMSSYRLYSVSSDDCILENIGRIQFFTPSTVPSVLDAVLQLFVSQNVICPEVEEMTF